MSINENVCPITEKVDCRDRDCELHYTDAPLQLDPELVGPQFRVSESEKLATGAFIYSVSAFAIPAPPLADDAGEPMWDTPEPTVRRIGRIWESSGGWVAAAPRLDDQPDNWHDEVYRSVRSFASQRDACMFLYGHLHAIGAVKFAESMAKMPWAKKRPVV